MARTTLFVFPDLLPWELDCVAPLLKAAGTDKASLVTVTEAEKNWFKKNSEKGSYWILSRDWRAAARFLGAKKRVGQRIFCSSLTLSLQKHPLVTLLWNRLGSTIPSYLHLLAHSPLEYRFYTEIGGVPKEQVTYLPLTLPEVVSGTKEKSSVVRVGALCEFNMEANLVSFLNVAHYALAKNQNLSFHLLGMGDLYSHLARVIQDLGIQNRVHLVEASSTAVVANLDLLLHVPLRNHHFVPILAAAAYRIPVLTSDMEGISQLVIDGKNGFVIPVNETKPMGELVLRVASDITLRESLGERLHQTFTEKFSPAVLWKEYSKLFSPALTRDAKWSKAA